MAATYMRMHILHLIIYIPFQKSKLLFMLKREKCGINITLNKKVINYL